MMAWMVESFDPEAPLTSAEITTKPVSAARSCLKSQLTANTGPFSRAFRPRSRFASSLRSATAEATLDSKLEEKLNVEHPAYEVVEKDIVTEYGAYCALYRHKKSGAELLSVANEDDNKVFGISFRTPPEY